MELPADRDHRHPDRNHSSLTGQSARSGQRAQCLSNLRQLTTAWILYAQENKQNLSGPVRMTRPTSCTGDAVHRIRITRRSAALDVPGSAGGIGAVKDGAMFKYLKTTEVYRCPSSIDKLNFSPKLLHQLSSQRREVVHSLQLQCDHPHGQSGPDLAPTRSSPFSTQAAGAAVFIEEYDQQTSGLLLAGGTTYNQGSFLNWKINGSGLITSCGRPAGLLPQEGNDHELCRRALRIQALERSKAPSSRSELQTPPTAFSRAQRPVELKQMLYGP